MHLISLIKKKRPYINSTFDHHHMQQPINIKIAVVIAVYNTAAYLRECIDSLLSQEHQNFTLFIVNDGSTDKSTEILNEYSSKNPKIKVTHSKNSGASVARNIALTQIEELGDFDLITFCDSDDIFSPKLLKSYAEIKSKFNADFITVGIKSFYKSGIKLSHRKRNAQHPPQLVFGNDILRFGFSDYLKDSPAASKCIGNTCFSAHTISGLRFNPKLRVGEDQDFRFRALLTCEKSVILSDLLYFYRIRKSSLSHSNNLTYQPLDLSLYLHWLSDLNDLPLTTREIIEKEALQAWNENIAKAALFKTLDQQWPLLKSQLNQILSLCVVKPKASFEMIIYSLGPIAIKAYSFLTKKQRCSLNKQKKRMQDAFD